MGSTKFYTYAHTLKATRPPLDQQSGGSANVDGSDGVGGSDGTGGSNGVCGSNDGGSTSIEVDVVEPVWVNDKSREHIVSVLTLIYFINLQTFTSLNMQLILLNIHEK